MKQIARTLIPVVLLGSAALRCAHAQVLYGSIVGTVTDPSNAAVAGATVRIKHRETGQTRTATTNEAGAYSFPSLPAGTYDISITKEGFQAANIEGVTVSVDQAARVDAALKVGSVTESIQVSADAAALQTESAEVRNEVNTVALENLPVPVNRNYESLFVTIPGFSPPENIFSGAANPSRGLTFSVNGTTRNTNNVRIDGASAANVWLGEVTAYVPALEAIDTVSVVTATFDQAQGMAAGTSVNVHIKSGTNDLHGSAFEYDIDSALMARPFAFTPVQAAQAMPKYINNDFGATLGGPIVRNRLFYFASFDANRWRQNAGRYVQVPTQAMRDGDFSASPALVYDPATGPADGSNRSQFEGNVIPKNRLDALALKIQKLYPLPNIPGAAGNNYYGTGNYAFDRNTTDAKVDWRATNKLIAAARLGWLNHNILNPAIFGDNGIGVGTGRVGHGFGNVYSGTLSATYIATPNFIFDGYFSTTRMLTNSEPPGMDKNYGLDVFGLPGTNGPNRQYGGYPTFVTGLQDIGTAAGGSGGPIYYDDRQQQYSANASWIKSAHNIRFGGEMDRATIDHFETNSAQGQFSFAGGTTGTRLSGRTTTTNQFNTYAAFLLGLVSSTSKDLLPFNGGRMIVHMPSYRLYIQDQWQAVRNLTVTYGLSWNYFPLGHRPDRGLERYLFNTNQVELCGVAGNPRNCGFDIPWKLFSPSLGIAWRATRTFVIRAGYSLNYDPTTFAYSRDMNTNYPQDLQLGLTSSALLWATTLASGLPPIVVPDISKGFITLPPGYGMNSLPDKVKRDYFQSWNFTLEKQLGWGFIAKTAYVATRGIDIPQQLNLNVAPIGAGPAGQPFNILYKNTAALRIMTPVNTTHYDSLQATLSRRFGNGFQVNASYTFGKNTGICCDDKADGAPAIQLLDYLPLARSIMPSDRTHKFAFAGVAELPFGKGKPILTRGLGEKLAGGWQLNALFVYYSGLPFSVTAPGTSLNSSGNTQRADLVKPKVAIYGGTGPGQLWFDTSAFAPVNDPRFGTAGYNILRGPNTVNLDLGLFRRFRINERFSLQFRAEAFNVTNTPHFANPNASTNSATFGTISAVTGTGREGIDQRALRLGLRLAF